MRAVRIHDFGGPGVMRFDELPMPQPAPNTALVRIYAAAVNPVDWMIREHLYNPPGADSVPLVLGQDFAGVIDLVGAGSSTALREGDEVLGAVWGSFAEYAVVPVSDLLAKPEGLDFATAAALPMPALTAWQSVVDEGRAGPGMTFLVHGAGGGVGSFAAQFARLRGARIVATAGPESLAFLRSIGIDEVIDYRHARFEERVHDVDVVLDPIGGETQARSWSVLAPGGLLINLVGEIDEEAAAQRGARGVAFGMRYDLEDLAEIVALVERGAVRPHISRIMPFGAALEALELSQRGEAHGKIVLEVVSDERRVSRR